MAKFVENSKIPKAVLVIFALQFLFFVLYYKNTPEDKSLLYVLIGIVTIGIILYILNFKLTIDSTIIKYGYIPCLPNHLVWEEVQSIQIIKNDALGDFLGWGIRSSKKYGRGYITDTDFAIYIQKKNGGKITLSINDKQRFLEFIKEIDKLHLIVD